VARHHPEPFLPAVLNRAGIGFLTSQTGSAKKAAASLQAVLAAGRTAICTVARERLPWHGERGELFGRDPYELGVIGLDGDTVYLDDVSARPWELPFADVMAAWTGYRKGRHTMLTLTGSDAAVNLAAAIEDAVATTCAHLTGPVLGNNFDVNFGFSGARKLAAQLADARGKAGWAARFGDPLALFFALRRLHDCVEIEYGAPGAMRPLYAGFLDEAAAVTGRAGYAEAAGLFRAAGERWSGVASAALGAAPQLVAYGELVEELAGVLAFGGPGSAAEAAALHERTAKLAAEFTADPPGDPRPLLDVLSAGVSAAVDTEERAVAVLQQ
jgi:hypothetical protein